MSIEAVREYLAQWNRDKDIQEFSVSSATVELAAAALHVKPERIVKTLSFRKEDGGCLLILAAGNTRIDNSKFKANFGYKATMLSPEQVLELTGHAVGGVCPFALPDGVEVFADEMLKKYGTVFPACGSRHHLQAK